MHASPLGITTWKWAFSFGYTTNEEMELKGGSNILVQMKCHRGCFAIEKK